MPAGAADLIKRRSKVPTPEAVPGGVPASSEARACAARLCIAWRIGPDGATELRWTIHDGLASAALHTAGAEAQQPLAEASLTRRIHDARAGLEHLEVEGLLWLTLRNAGDCPPTLLFARTTLLTRLSIPGGRYAAPRLL